jgi:transketolase
MNATAPEKKSAPDLDQLSINTIRFLAVDMVQKADSGHPGMPMGSAPMAYVLWTRFLKYNPESPEWFDRDRFVLSAGHGSPLLYSLLYLTGFGVSLDDIKQFRQWGSITPGHPERELTQGVEATTGPLGQGFANGVGMAMAEAQLAATFNRDGHEIIDHRTYGILSDGDLMEGVASEAASLAGHLKLGKLIYFYDNNSVTLSAGTAITFTEDKAKRFEAYGWHTQVIEDGNDLAAIDEALRAAQAETTRPSIIIVSTHIGYGSPNKQDSYQAHGSALGEEEVRLTKENLDWPTEPPFRVPEAALAHFREATTRGAEAEADWNERFGRYADVYPELARDLKQRLGSELPDGWDADIPAFPADEDGMATRVAAGKVVNAIAPRVPALMGGSGDLDPSTHSALKEQGDFEQPSDAECEGSQGGGWSFRGRNLHFGVREHAMGSILNGMAAHGAVIPFGATFLVFSDYMRPAIRLAALMSLRVIYIFTHDSLALGQDGPTHQPVEHLASFRAMPNITVIRPGDANETAVAWRIALETTDRPVALVLTRQNVPTLDREKYASAEGTRRGAYVVADAPNGEPDVILIASGSELGLVVAARDKLAEQNINARVVSMPSWALFDAQSDDYRASILPPSVTARLAVEAAAPLGWARYVGDHGDVLGVTTFGASAPGPKVMAEYGFTVDNVCKRAHALTE